MDQRSRAATFFAALRNLAGAAGRNFLEFGIDAAVRKRQCPRTIPVRSQRDDGGSLIYRDIPPSFAQGMNKSGLIDFVQKGMGRDASRVHADRAVSLVIEGLKAGLQRDKIVQLVGFGTLKVIERKARAGIHPKTLKPLKIEPFRTVKMTIGKDLKSGI